MKCPSCRSSKFRPSKFRVRDIFKLLRFRYPVRCRYCRKRSFAPVPQLLGIYRAYKLSLKEASVRKEKGESSTPNPA